MTSIHRDKKEKEQARERLSMLSTPLVLPKLKQTHLLFHQALRAPLEPPSVQLPFLKLEDHNNSRAEELLLDTLIREDCGDENALKDPLTIQKVLNSIQTILSNSKQLYLPRIIYDLQLLKQYTANMLKEGQYHLDCFAAS